MKRTTSPQNCRVGKIYLKPIQYPPFERYLPSFEPDKEGIYLPKKIGKDPKKLFNGEIIT